MTGEPVADFHIYDSNKCDEMDKLPKCDFCHEPIMEETAYQIGNELICHKCIKNWEVSIDDLRTTSTGERESRF